MKEACSHAALAIRHVGAGRDWYGRARPLSVDVIREWVPAIEAIRRQYHRLSERSGRFNGQVLVEARADSAIAVGHVHAESDGKRRLGPLHIQVVHQRLQKVEDWRNGKRLHERRARRAIAKI